MLVSANGIGMRWRTNGNAEDLMNGALDIPNFEKIDNLKEGDVFEDLGVKQSVQVLPKNEYIIITAPEDSDEWAELKTIFPQVRNSKIRRLQDRKHF